jgi:glycosyltransferase involved in cell wall biosynthesis
MRTMIHYRHMGVVAPEQSFAPFRRFLFNRILRQRSATSVLTIDPTLAEFARQQSEPYFRKIQYVPDPVNYYGSLPPKSEARRRLNIPSDASVVLLYGEITPRKGALLLVNAVASPECSGRVHVILAGRNRMSEILSSSNAFQSLLEQRRIHILDGFIDDEHEQLLLAATDCLWVGYTDFYGVSGVMALAGRHSVPVLASDYGLVGHFTRKHELGVVIEPRNPATIVAALNRLVADPSFFLRAGRNAVPVFEPHDPIALQQVVTNVVERSWAQ